MKDRTGRLLFVWLSSMLLGPLLGYWIYISGKANDCQPHEIDGQCGLSTFVGGLYGLVVAGAIPLISTIIVAIIAARRK